jgi:DNA-binding GntR family transcriptional regulator
VAKGQHDGRALGVTLYQRLKVSIVSGQLKPGEAVSERTLVQRFGGSRTPVRYALARLQEQGLITADGRRGYSVTPLGLQDVAEVLFLRRVLEGAAAELAARRITEDRLAELERLARMTFSERSPDGYAHFVRVNRDFHLGIAAASGNSRLLRAIAPLLDDMRRIITSTVSQTHDIKAMQREHQSVTAALRRRDARAARQALVAALESGERRISRMLNMAKAGA